MRSLRMITLVAATFLTATGCDREPTRGVAVPKEFRGFISPDTKALLDLNVDSLEQSSLWKAHQDLFDLSRANSVTSEVGLDPKKDVSNLLAEWDGKNVLLLVHGHFDQAKIKNKLSSLNAAHRQIAEHEIYSEGNNAFALITSDLAIGGSAAAVEAALARKGTPSVPDELKARMQDVPAGSQFWVVSRGGLPFAEVPMRSDYESLLSNIVRYVRDTSLGMTATSGLKLQGSISCVSAQGAQRVHDALRGAIGFGRLSTPDNKPQLLRAYDALHVDQTGQDVHLNADLPQDLADQLLSSIPKN